MNMGMEIDESRKKIHARSVEHVFLFLVGISSSGRATNGLNPVSFDDDIKRPSGRSPLSVNNDDVPDDQPLIPLPAFHAFCLRIQSLQEQKAKQSNRDDFNSSTHNLLLLEDSFFSPHRITLSWDANIPLNSVYFK